MNWINGMNIRHDTGFIIPKNVWMRHRIEWNFGKNGYWKHWIDGKLICSWTGQVGDGSGPGYFKFGSNGWGSDALNSRMYIDLVQVWEAV